MNHYNSFLQQVNLLSIKNSKYLKWYTQIVNNALIRASSRKEAKAILGYTEKHHILPTCIGGPNVTENCVFLTAREHFIVHRLLVKIFPKESKLTFALWGLANQENQYQKRKYKINSKTYELLKILRSEQMSIILTGRKVSDETKAKMSAAAKGKPKKPQTAAHSKKISLANIGKPKSELAIKNMVNSTRKYQESRTLLKQQKIQFYNEKFKESNLTMKQFAELHKINYTTLKKYLAAK